MKRFVFIKKNSFFIIVIGILGVLLNYFLFQGEYFPSKEKSVEEQCSDCLETPFLLGKNQDKQESLYYAPIENLRDGSKIVIALYRKGKKVDELQVQTVPIRLNAWKENSLLLDVLLLENSSEGYKNQVKLWVAETNENCSVDNYECTFKVSLVR